MPRDLITTMGMFKKEAQLSEHEIELDPKSAPSPTRARGQTKQKKPRPRPVRTRRKVRVFGILKLNWLARFMAPMPIYTDEHEADFVPDTQWI